MDTRTPPREITSLIDDLNLWHLFHALDDARRELVSATHQTATTQERLSRVREDLAKLETVGRANLEAKTVEGRKQELDDKLQTTEQWNMLQRLLRQKLQDDAALTQAEALHKDLRLQLRVAADIIRALAGV